MTSCFFLDRSPFSTLPLIGPLVDPVRPYKIVKGSFIIAGPSKVVVPVVVAAVGVPVTWAFGGSTDIGLEAHMLASTLGCDIRMDIITSTIGTITYDMVVSAGLLFFLKFFQTIELVTQIDITILGPVGATLTIAGTGGADQPIQEGGILPENTQFLGVAA